jgi:hypothetical protein
VLVPKKQLRQKMTEKTATTKNGYDKKKAATKNDKRNGGNTRQDSPGGYCPFPCAGGGAMGPKYCMG